MKKSNVYIFGFVIFCLMALVKLVALVTVAVNLIAYLANTASMETVPSRIILALLADFLALMIMWALNKGLKIYKKPTSLLSLLAPVLLLAVFAISLLDIVLDTSGSTGATLVYVLLYALMGLYLLVPDIFIARDMYALRHGFPRDGEDAAEPTLSERIRKAKR